MPNLKATFLNFLDKVLFGKPVKKTVDLGTLDSLKEHLKNWLFEDLIDVF